ncbi:hypothetical protein KHM19_06550 [Leptospira borgpetersenii]|nr:hypothetical protein KHM09_12940 [Leptospira borgpetersenii]GIM21472.1 hypothetical protein KHM19_06550 [Leptospira borgpetersenii]GIM24729.1 hypothetical protein KHM25_06540 [Leptospira borgpetersenii]
MRFQRYRAIFSEIVGKLLRWFPKNAKCNFEITRMRKSVIMDKNDAAEFKSDYTRSD